MSKVTDTITVTIGLRLWFRMYLATLMFLCEAMGTEPDMDKLTKMISRGIYVE